jgi:hypothetical protein
LSDFGDRYGFTIKLILAILEMMHKFLFT